MNHQNEIHQSLVIVTEMLNDRGFNTEKLSINHDTIKILEKNNKLEFILDKNDSDEICCIKYMMQKIRPTYMKQTLEELIENYKLDSKNSTIILILKESPGQTVDKVVNATIIQKGNFIQLFLLKNLLFNITKHIAVPKHTILNNMEVENLIKNFKLKSKQQLPVILKTDPIAKYHGMRVGDICEIERASITGGEYKSYRFCR